MVEDTLDSFRKSKWKFFDRSFAAMIKEKYPDVWDEGGNIKGNDQYEILTKIAEQGGVAKTTAQVEALKIREAWVARHKEDYRLPGVIAQIKWLAIGSRGEDYMKRLVRAEIEKIEKIRHMEDANNRSFEFFLKHKGYSDSEVLEIKSYRGEEMTPEEIGEYLEHRGATDEEIEDFLEHFGVKGMKWGVRRRSGSGASDNKNGGSRKLSGKAKFARNLIVGVTLGAATGTVLGMALNRAGARAIKNARFKDVSARLATMSDKEKAEAGRRIAQGLGLKVTPSKSPNIKVTSYAKQLKALQDYTSSIESQIGKPSAKDLADAARKLGI